MLAQALPTGQLPKFDSPEGANPARRGSKMASKRPPDGSFVPVGPTKAARKGALGTLVALLEPSWGPSVFPGRSWALLVGRFGTLQGLIWTIWTLSVAQREIQQKHRILRCFRASRASRRRPKAFQNRPGRPLGRGSVPKLGLEGPSGGTEGPS